MPCKVFYSEPRSAEENMSFDASLLHSLAETREPILHFYNWATDAATFGHFIKPENVFQFSGVNEKKLDLARRPTGGGVVFHNCDLAFSFLLPASHSAFSLRPLDNYYFVNEKVREAIDRFLGKKTELLTEHLFPHSSFIEQFCIANPTKFDVMWSGKKVGGAAQRKTREGYLHQGSIFLGLLSEDYLSSILIEGKTVYQEMQRNSCSLLGINWTKEDLALARENLKKCMHEVFKKV